MAQVGCLALNPEAILQQTIRFQRSTKIRSLSPQNQIGARALRCVGRRELLRKGLSTNFSCKLF
ncbi:hypothetical protein I3760_01G280400 [Carya illinoinensis]|nr:hypothetical protein I3760_01G280400 [Carya illinoinensis]